MAKEDWSSLGEGLQTLDPADWESFRSQAHRMLDDMLDYTKNIRRRPVWQPIPEQVRERFQSAIPAEPSPLADVHQEFMNYILPFAVGNVHPGFIGWVHGGGTPVGMLAEMLAGGLNANLGGRDQMPIEVERQVARWMREIFGFPEGASGLFVTGTSMANFVAAVIARDAALGSEVRRRGMAGKSQPLAAYASAAVHGCVSKALDLCGIGSDALRLVPTDSRGRMSLADLENAIQEDRKGGCLPFWVVGTAGTVNTGAIDDLAAIADLAQREKLWFHVDGAYGALAILAPELAAKLRGIERADSLAFDFHKWGQVPYDAGFILVRDGDLHRRAFTASSDYLRRETRGLAAGSPWPCDYGPDLSRGFRALKTWFTLKVYGSQALGSTIARTCALARFLEHRIAETPELELLAPVELNIVCFRYRAYDSNRVNAQIVVELQESGMVAPSTTTLNGLLAIRAAIVNHRTEQGEIDLLIAKTLAIGRAIENRRTAVHPAPQPAGAMSLPHTQWETELRQIAARLSSDPSSVELRFRRASVLTDLGRFVEARNEYLKVLEREPSHPGALNSLGRVLAATGHLGAAAIVYKEAVARHPNDPTSRANLGLFLLEESERLAAHEKGQQSQQLRREAREHFEQALHVSPNFEKAHEGMSYLGEELGDAAKAAWHRREAFRNRAVTPLPYRGRGAPVPVLYLASTTGGNAPLKKFLNDRIYQTFIVLPEYHDGHTPLPLHRIVVNAIGDVEVASGALAAAESLLTLTNAPVINPPSAVLVTSRGNNARRFSAVPGVVTPTTVTLPRGQLSDSEAPVTLARLGLAFPILLRAPGFHTGMNFLRVDNLAALSGALRELPGPELIVMQYLDACGADGKSRKYRVMAIGGQLYPLHVAISSRWKIHYFTAEMAENSAHRAEDAAFLENMPATLGPVAMKALERLQSLLGLDYGGFDFGLNSQGEVLLFEANATMVVNPPDREERWKYRWPAYKRICAAVQKMLFERSQIRERRSVGSCSLAPRLVSSVSARRLKRPSVSKQLSLQPEVWRLLKQGIEHHQAGRAEIAEACYRRALVSDPRCPQALHLLGLLAQQAGQYKKSVELIQAALALDPDDPPTLNSLAESALGEGDLELVRDCCRRVAELHPEPAKAHHRFGRLLERHGHWEEAGQSYRRAICLLRDSPDFHASLARLECKLGAFKEAVKSCQRAMARAPEKVETYNLLGNIFTEQGSYPLAVEVFRRALDLQPDSVEAICGLGFLLQRQGNLAAAADSYRCALKLAPNLLKAYVQLGIILVQQSDLAKAEQCFARARELDPLSPDALYRLGTLHLLQGNFRLGWKEYEYRQGTAYGVRHNRRFRQNLWKGEALQGSRILLHAEQGLGDTLQFVRYVPLVAARGGKIILEVQPRLHGLLAQTPGAEKVVRCGEALPEFDWQCPLLSLPMIFGTGPDTVPANIPYIFADPVQAAAWKQRLSGKPLRVGLAWGGNPKYPHDLRRSIPLKQLAPLTNLTGTTFYSLQMGPPAGQITQVGEDLRLIDLQHEQQDFADTAALVANLDLVISIDTSIAHLAGAMGKPVWVLLHKSSDWRWLLDREDNPWYPTARLFRQTALGNWQDVVARIEQELHKFVSL